MRNMLSKAMSLTAEGGLLLAFWMLGVVVFAQFFFRYFLNMPLGWTEEIARYLLIACAFWGLPVVTQRGEHIAIEMLPDALPPAARKGLKIIAEVILLAIVAALVWQAFTLAAMSSQTMSSFPLPKAIIYYVVLSGLVMQFLVGLVRLVRLVGRHATEETPS